MFPGECQSRSELVLRSTDQMVVLRFILNRHCVCHSVVVLDRRVIEIIGFLSNGGEATFFQQNYRIQFFIKRNLKLFFNLKLHVF